LLLWLMFWLGAVGPFAVVCIGLSFILKVSPNRKKKWFVPFLIFSDATKMWA